MDEEQPVFKCKECGNAGLYIEYNYDYVEPCTGLLECRCGKRDDFAAVRRYTAITKCIERAPIENCSFYNLNHAIIEEVSDRIKEDLSIDDVLCEACFESAKEEDWSDQPDEPDDVHGPYNTNENAFVRCAGCNREIEFGWKHPSNHLTRLTGGIRSVDYVCPAECSDFSPGKCWPDPKYKDRWVERGWCDKSV